MLLFFETLYLKVCHFFYRIKNRCEKDYLHSKLGMLGKNSYLINPKVCLHPEKIFLYDNTNILDGATFIISESSGGNFIMKENSGAAQNLTVITGNHQRILGVPLKIITAGHQYDIDKDIIIEDDVWIGANVTLLPGTVIGRGATIGAGSVVRTKIPPYAIVTGNPAKVMGFAFDPAQTIEHELIIYPESERLSIEVLEKNYQKYFKNRLKNIVEYQKL